MHNRGKAIEKEIFNVTSAAFESLALKIFLFQYEFNETYNAFCRALNTDPLSITSIDRIPFLPIQFFKSHNICTTDFEPILIFESSGTTGSVNSRHLVKEVSLYKKSFSGAFDTFYGDAKDLCIIGLLPSYLERGNSSLVYMVNDLINQSKYEQSGFYLYDHEKLHKTLLHNEENKIPTLLIGVTYALLDFAEKFPTRLKHCIVMETGGMKGKREELTREEVHNRLKKQLGLTEIHSEYGMTELLSQAYSNGNGIFNCPQWMKVLLRAEDDPFDVQGYLPDGVNAKSGIVNVVDLANLYSCSFIATDDVGKLYKDGSFEILGRMDNSDIRGCGLMIL